MYFNKLNIVTFYCESQSLAKPGDKGETRLCTFKSTYIIEFSSIWAETWSVWKILKGSIETHPQLKAADQNSFRKLSLKKPGYSVTCFDWRSTFTDL